MKTINLISFCLIIFLLSCKSIVIETNTSKIRHVASDNQTSIGIEVDSIKFEKSIFHLNDTLNIIDGLGSISQQMGETIIAHQISEVNEISEITFNPIIKGKKITFSCNIVAKFRDESVRRTYKNHNVSLKKAINDLVKDDNPHYIIMRMVSFNTTEGIQFYLIDNIYWVVD